MDPEEPRADFDRGEPPRGPAFLERAPQDGVLGIDRHGDFAGHDEQFQKELLLRQGNGHGGDDPVGVVTVFVMEPDLWVVTIVVIGIGIAYFVNELRAGGSHIESDDDSNA